MPNLFLISSSTATVAGTTSRPMPSPGMTAIEKRRASFSAIESPYRSREVLDGLVVGHSKLPLTRPAPSGESAGSEPPSPLGRGQDDDENTTLSLWERGDRAAVGE